MATVIDPTTANSLILGYQSQNSSYGNSGNLTNAGKSLNGFFIDRECIEAIFNNNPGATGISVLLAKHPDFAKATTNQYTILVVGSQPNPAQNPATPLVATGDIYGPVPPCPPNCPDMPIKGS
jgi:hypothetical protein